MSVFVGEPVDPPALSPARGPPFFKSRAVRRKFGELEAPRAQTEIFEASLTALRCGRARVTRRFCDHCRSPRLARGPEGSSVSAICSANASAPHRAIHSPCFSLHRLRRSPAAPQLSELRAPGSSNL